MTTHLLKKIRREVSELECPKRRKRREKIRRRVKQIRIYKNLVDSIEYHPVLISLMVFMYKMQ